jgi:restriction endonuclease S subunit/predicted GIY-YIG superfamily endonuclease
MKSSYKVLGPYIQPVDERNTALEDLLLMGLSVSKQFFPTIANLVGTDMKTYKIVYRNQFTYIADTSRRGDKIAIALNDRFDKMLVSQAYTPFEVKDTNELDPEYLMMWFRRPEFDRYARFKSHGSAREIFDWEEMCNVKLPIPHIDKQRKIVKEYNTIQSRINLNQQMIQKLEETAQAIYKQWFVEFEFPCLPSDYRPHGQVNLSAEFKSIMTYKKVGGLPVPDGKSWFAYVLLCDDGSFYKGMTNDLYRRFYDHYTGNGSEWTKANKPVKVIHWEQFFSQEEAAKREKKLKSGYGRTWLQRQWAKVNGGSPAPECQLRMAGEMFWCEELGKEIPKGWEIGNLGDVLECNPETLSSIDSFKRILYLDTSNITNNRINELQELDLENDEIPSRARRKVKDNDIVFSTVRPALKHYGIIKNLPENLIVSTGFAVFRVKEPKFSSELIYSFLSDEKTVAYLQAKAEMSVSTYPSITSDDIMNLDFAKPDDNVLDTARNIFRSKDDFINLKNKENQKLSELKDLLLSKLATVEG